MVDQEYTVFKTSATYEPSQKILKGHYLCKRTRFAKVRCSTLDAPLTFLALPRSPLNDKAIELQASDTRRSWFLNYIKCFCRKCLDRMSFRENRLSHLLHGKVMP